MFLSIYLSFYLCILLSIYLSIYFVIFSKLLNLFQPPFLSPYTPLGNLVMIKGFLCKTKENSRKRFKSLKKIFMSRYGRINMMINIIIVLLLLLLLLYCYYYYYFNYNFIFVLLLWSLSTVVHYYFDY